MIIEFILAVCVLGGAAVILLAAGVWYSDLLQGCRWRAAHLRARIQAIDRYFSAGGADVPLELMETRCALRRQAGRYAWWARALSLGGLLLTDGDRKALSGA